MINYAISNVLLAVGVIASSFAGYAPTPVQALNEVPIQQQIIAHRGYSALAPENTVAAFQAAVKHRADAIEFDIHVTRDGIPVVMHDDTLDRTTNGTGPIKNKTLAELKTLNAGNNQRIPTLQETLQAAKGRVIYSEIKGTRTPADLETIVKTIIANGYENRDIMLAFNYQNLLSTRLYSKQITLGFLTDDQATFNQALNLASRDGNAVLLASAPLLLGNPNLITQARQKGIDVGAWTVNSLDQAHRLQQLGIKRIITDTLVERLRQ